jgi:3,4-dihydroxy 2-butanone 4-phosphate synthase/GTP cyclohydrolase II
MTALAPDFEVLHSDPLVRVQLAIEDIAAGRMVILVDDEDRENEGDLVIAAEKCTPAAINFMATHARGLICLSLTTEQVDRLGLPLMSTHNQSPYNTAFTVSIEARDGVSTGISAADRARTVLAAIRPDATRRDVVTPGHMFPLRARDGGVLERVGQTEGSVDLARMAGLLPAGVICEVMRDDGEMARLPDLVEFGKKHGIRVVAVADLIKWRLRTERIVTLVGEGSADVAGIGQFRTCLYRGARGEHHVALALGDLHGGPTVVRVQTSPPAWAFLSDDTSRLARQARSALQRIADEGRGALVLMHQGGMGADDVETQWLRDFAGGEPGPTRARADELRDLGAGCQILRDLGLAQLRLLVGSSRSVVGVEAYGLSIVERIGLSVA